MTGLYSIVPFEGTIYLIKSMESMPLEGEQLETVDSLLKEGKTVAEMQEELANVWAS